MESKKRIDTFLFEKGFFDSREKAKAEILAGNVFLNGNRIDKPGFQVKGNEVFDIKEKFPYVSRGAMKIQKAVNHWNLDLRSAIVLDIGASTGGFTDFALQNGAVKSYAVDVGYGQLDYKLRKDERVINLERTNARDLDIKIIKDVINFIFIDVSFISLKHIFPTVQKIANDKTITVALIKPQFEAERSEVGKGGIVKDVSVHESVLEKIKTYATTNGLHLEETTMSPIKGAKGNTEFLALIKKT